MTYLKFHSNLTGDNELTDGFHGITRISRADWNNITAVGTLIRCSTTLSAAIILTVYDKRRCHPYELGLQLLFPSYCQEILIRAIAFQYIIKKAEHNGFIWYRSVWNSACITKQENDKFHLGFSQTEHNANISYARSIFVSKERLCRSYSEMCVKLMQMIGNFVSYVIDIPEDVPNPFPNILHYGKFTGVDLTYFESRIFRH